MAANKRPNDPTLDQIEQFFQKHFFKPGPTGSNSAELENFLTNFKKTKYQIIRGWINPVKRDRLPAKILESIDDLSMIKERADSPPENFLEIYLKGHALKKKIYCLWESDTVLYCPDESFANTQNHEKQPDNFSENWFAEEKPFFYFYERKNTCLEKKFYEFKQIEKFARADDTASRDCNGIAK